MMALSYYIVQAVPGFAEAPPPPYAQLPPPLAYPLPPQPFYPPAGYGPDPGWVYLVQRTDMPGSFPYRVTPERRDTPFTRRTVTQKPDIAPSAPPATLSVRSATVRTATEEGYRG